MSTALSLSTMNGGGIVEAVDEALAKIAENIADVNTPPEKPRKLVLEIVFKPNKERNFPLAKATVKTNLQPQEAQEIPLLLEKEGGAHLLYEAARDHNPGQMRMEGTMPADLRESSPKNVTKFKAANN